MSTDTIVMILIPLALATLMWGLGLNLTAADFQRVKKSPREVIMALGIQLIVVPAFAILLNWVFNLPPAFAMGLLLLASTPGGPTANILSHLGGGQCRAQCDFDCGELADRYCFGSGDGASRISPLF